MKPFQSLIPAALVLTIALTACTENTSTTETTADSTATPYVTVADPNQGKLEANKKLVTDFYQAFYGDKDSTAIDKYIADNIKQHNPLLQDGKEWFKTNITPFLANPNAEKIKIDIKQVAADGDLVWLLVRDVAPNKKEFARVEIFRVENGKISENWKVSEPISEKSDNKNGPF